MSNKLVKGKLKTRGIKLTKSIDDDFEKLILNLHKEKINMRLITLCNLSKNQFGRDDDNYLLLGGVTIGHSLGKYF